MSASLIIEVLILTVVSIEAWISFKNLKLNEGRKNKRRNQKWERQENSAAGSGQKNMRF